MESDEASDVFIDHVETQIQLPRPRQLSSSGAEITLPEDAGNSQSELATQSHAATTTTTTTTTTQVATEETSNTTLVEKHVTTIYTRRISGRSSSGSSETTASSQGMGDDAPATQTETETESESCGGVFVEKEEQRKEEVAPTAGFVFGLHSQVWFDGERAGEIVRPKSAGGDQLHSPAEDTRGSRSPTDVYSSIAVSVGSTGSSSTTAVYSRVFSMTVDTTSDTEPAPAGKERHLSECSLDLSGPGAPGDLNGEEKAGDQEAKENRVSVQDPTAEEIRQQATVETGLVLGDDMIFPSDQENTQERNGDTSLECRADSMFQFGPQTMHVPQETGVFSGAGPSASQTFTQKAVDTELPELGLGATEESSSSVIGFSILSQRQELWDTGRGATDVEAFSTSKTQDSEKEASEYCPGLAIRTLTLEDLKEKRTSPEPDPVSTAADAGGTQDVWVGQSSEISVFQRTTTQTTTVVTSSQTSESRTASGQILMQCTDDTKRQSGSMAARPIEVERKFTVADGTEDRLRSLGAQLQTETVFTDVYFDNDDYSLILTDCWLRRRNEAWEAKIAVRCGDNALDKPATQYSEITEEKQVSAWLVDRLGLDPWLRGDPVDLLVQAAGLAEFARFTTTRRSYTMNGCSVDLDLTDHGFRVGEIEVMAASPEDVPQALKTINQVAEQLGLCPLKLL